jgi:hypothetical protein
LRIERLNELMDTCKRQGLCETYARYKAERDALLDGLPGAKTSPAQDQAAAEPSEEPQATTPQYESLKKVVLSAIRDYYSPDADSHLVYHTRVFDAVMTDLIQASWLVSPDSAMPGDCSSFRPAAAEPSPEVKAALAQVAEELVPATPQEELKARRAYEADTNDYLLGRLSGFSQAAALMDKLGLDGDAERFRSEERRLANVLAARGCCLNSEAPAANDVVDLLEKVVWVRKANGSVWTETIKSYHVAPDADRCYLTSTGAILWGKDFGIKWSLTADALRGADESPAKPAKRVPKIGDVILGDGCEWLVYHINLTGMAFWAVKLGPNENCTELFDVENEGKEHKEGGWSFKD